MTYVPNKIKFWRISPCDIFVLLEITCTTGVTEYKLARKVILKTHCGIKYSIAH